MTSLLVSSPAWAEHKPQYGQAFWEHWGDGYAELAAYELTFPRYGHLRTGTAVAIFVTETFDRASHVKTDRPAGSSKKTFPVIKLNLVQDFPTGIYDYNMMTSAFVALEPVNGLPAASPTKISFSSQEWCGHVYHQALFERGGIRHQMHSYFEGEADQKQTLRVQRGGIAEDTLLLWARGLAGPLLQPGESITVPLLRSLQYARLSHAPLTWDSATLSRSKDHATVTVSAGTFKVDTYRAVIKRAAGDSSPGQTWTFLVESSYPHRIIRWSSTLGHNAELLGSDRLKYWQLHDPGQEEMLKRIGLTPHAPRVKAIP